MKYRVRIDLAFTEQADAQALMDYARNISDKAVSVNAGKVSEETAFCDFEICRHEEGLPCTRLERLEVGKG